MTDIRDILKRQLGAQGKGVAGALPGSGAKALEDRLRGGTTPTAEAERAALYAPVDLYLATDGTASMRGPIDAVAQGMKEISEELLHAPDRGEIRISPWAVYDHNWTELTRHYPLISDLQILSRNIRSVTNLDTNYQDSYHADHVEGYECGWLEIAKEIRKQQTGSSLRKKAVVFMGDMLPHGLARDAHFSLPAYFTILSGPLDNGCPHQVNYKTAWKALTTAADLTLFVGCADYESSQYKGTGVSAVQQTLINPQDSKQKFVSLQDVGDIPAIIMTATRLAQSETAVREYIARLQLTDSGRATRIAGLLGTTKR